MPFDPVAFINAHEWTFAKTMPDNPHEYVARKNVARDFDDMVRFIREHGHARLYQKRLYLYWEHDGWLYWSMGWPVNETIIINRARIEDSKAIPMLDSVVDSGRWRWSGRDGRRPPL
jgi:hypothetical protein